MCTCACDEARLQDTRSVSYMYSSRSIVDDCLHRVMGHRRKYEAHATLDPTGLPKIGLPAGFLVCTCASSISIACFVRNRAIKQGVIVLVPWQ